MSENILLNQEDVELRLNKLHNWEINNNEINREIGAANFAAAVGVVNAVAILAEKADHHPDILLYGWNKIRITLTSHDKGGLTNKDFDLAEEIDSLNF